MPASQGSHNFHLCRVDRLPCHPPPSIRGSELHAQLHGPPPRGEGPSGRAGTPQPKGFPPGRTTAGPSRVSLWVTLESTRKSCSFFDPRMSGRLEPVTIPARADPCLCPAKTRVHLCDQSSRLRALRSRHNLRSDPPNQARGPAPESARGTVRRIRPGETPDPDSARCAGLRSPPSPRCHGAAASSCQLVRSQEQATAQCARTRCPSSSGHLKHSAAQRLRGQGTV